MARGILLSACSLLASLHGGVAARARARKPQRLPQLPSVPLQQSQEAPAQGWWLQDEELAYFPPAEAGGKLSQDIADYYYALGEASALMEKHQQLRVGGKGNVHIFHVPADSLSEMRPGLLRRRGSSLSELRRVTAGMKLGRHPNFELPADYQDPLGSDALAVERQVMSELTEASYTGYLTELTNSSSPRLPISTRNTDDTEATKRLTRYLEEQFTSTGVTTCVQYFETGTWFWKKEIYNIIGLVPGTSPGSVLLGAHFDDLPSSNAPGAEDNGSGSAAVLAALKAFMATGARPQKSLYFVLFGGEEQGLIGSKRFAEELKSPGSSDSPIPEACRVASTSDHTAFTMDMIGYRSPKFATDTALVETRDWAKDAVANPLAMSNQVNNGGSITLRYSNRPFGSDHLSFLNNNFPCSLVIDGDGQTSDYPCYHRSCDTMDYIDTKFATETARMNLGAALRAAGIS